MYALGVLNRNGTAVNVLRREPRLAEFEAKLLHFPLRLSLLSPSRRTPYPYFRTTYHSQRHQKQNHTWFESSLRFPLIITPGSTNFPLCGTVAHPVMSSYVTIQNGDKVKVNGKQI
jgi:hypothetical protein